MRKIGLALGGGGARGAAHIGVLQELGSLNVRPDVIAGTSIGAAVGAMVAAGLSLEQIHEFFVQFDLRTLFKMSSGLPSLSNNTKLTQLLESFIGRPTFAELERPLMIVTTDIVAQKEVVLVEGDVVSAVIASMAFPIVFPPVERDGLTLVDGGLVNNTPFDVVRAHGATYVIAVDLGKAAPYGSKQVAENGNTGLLGRALNYTKQRPMWQVMTALTDIITSRSMNARLAISPPDLLLQPYMGTVGLFDFHDLTWAIEAGRTCVRENQNRLIDTGITPT